jgi:hypothetical protein
VAGAVEPAHIRVTPLPHLWTAAKRAFAAMIEMSKIDIASIEAARRG